MHRAALTEEGEQVDAGGAVGTVFFAGTFEPDSSVIFTAYIDSQSLAANYFLPSDMKIGAESTKAIADHTAPKLKMNVDAENLLVSYVCAKHNDVMGMTIKEFVEAGGHAIVFSAEMAQYLARILTLETEIAHEVKRRKLLQDLSKTLPEKIRQAELELEKVKKETAFPEVVADATRKWLDEKTFMHNVDEEVKMSEAPLEMLQSDLMRSSSIIVGQLLSLAWAQLTPQQQSSAAGYRFHNLDEQAHPTFNLEDHEAVEHAIHHARVPQKAVEAVNAAFVAVFGQAPPSADVIFSYNSGDPSEKLHKVAKALYARQEKQFDAIKKFMASQVQMMEQMMNQRHKMMEQMMNQQRKMMEQMMDQQQKMMDQQKQIIAQLVQNLDQA